MNPRVLEFCKLIKTGKEYPKSLEQSAFFKSHEYDWAHGFPSAKHVQYYINMEQDIEHQK